MLDPVEACVVANCADVTSAELTDCALDNCGMELDALPSDCFTCLAANVALGDLALIRSICESAGGGRYAYGGSFGTGILSRHPLAETDSLLLTSTTNRRAVLYARIPDTAIGEIHFFCTHLTANLSSVPYTGDAAGWRLRAGTGHRFLDETIEIVVDGMTTTSAYSDHYGLVVPVRLE